MIKDGHGNRHNPFKTHDWISQWTFHKSTLSSFLSLMFTLLSKCEISELWVDSFW